MRTLISGLLAAAACHGLAYAEAPTAADSDFVSTATPCSAADGYFDRHPERQDRIFYQHLLDLLPGACALPTDDVTATEAREALGAKRLAWAFADDAVTLYARAEPGPPLMCCSLMATDWRPLGETGLWTARTHIRDLDRAMLYQFLGADESGEQSETLVWRGPDAPAKPAFMDDVDQALSGAVVETSLWSPELGEGRKLSIYLPPGHDPAKTWPVLVMTDGQALPYYARLVEPLIEQGEVAPFIMVGLHSGTEALVDIPGHEIQQDAGQTPSFDVRAADYIPYWKEAPQRFSQHLNWVALTVLPRIQSEYGGATDPARVTVAGKSNGGVFALHSAARRPDVFGTAIVMSPGREPVWATKLKEDGKQARFLISAGTLEFGFYSSARTSHRELEKAGYDVSFTPYIAGHALDQWATALAAALPRAFPPDVNE